MVPSSLSSKVIIVVTYKLLTKFVLLFCVFVGIFVLGVIHMHIALDNDHKEIKSNE